MKKLLVAVSAAAVLLCAFTSCSKKTAKEAEAPQGQIFNIYCWNDEFQGLFKKYFEAQGKVPADIKINWILTPNQDNAYQNKLDETLLKQADAAADDKIDMFLVEADYALKYVDTSYTMAVKELGITDDDLANQFKYTKDIMTDSKGVLKGVSWQGCPGGFIYRRSIAKDVLGTDDPEEVQEALSDWDKFDAVAAKAKAKGYFMLSGFDDDFRVFSDNAKTPWVQENKINVDSSIKRWISQTKEYTDNGYNNKANLWSAESWAGAKKDGKVFGYFGPAWFLSYSLGPQTLEDSDAEQKLGNGSFGDWGMCVGPEGFSWGGTWICAATGTDNTKLIKDIMYAFTCDKDFMMTMAKDSQFMNNTPVMKTIAADSSFGYPFLGGQNPDGMFLTSANSIDRSSMGPYDQGMAECIQAAFADYYNGTVDEQGAWDNFYKSVIEKYPNLEK